MLSDSALDSGDLGRPRRLNAPYGARCYLTGRELVPVAVDDATVLMHLMALGAI